MSHIKTRTPVTWLKKPREDVDAIDIHPDVYIVGTCTTGTNLLSSILRNLYTEMFNIYSHTQRIHYNVLLNVKRAQLWLNNHHQHQPWLQRSGHHQDVAEVDMVDQGILKQRLAWSDSMCCSWSSWRYQKHPTQLLGLHVLLLEHSRNTQEQASLYSVHTFIIFYLSLLCGYRDK